MNKIILTLIILAILSSCKQDIESKDNYKSGNEDLEKLYGHLFDEEEDSTQNKDYKPKAFSTAKYTFNFQDIDQALFDSYKANSQNLSLIETLPNSIKHKDSCFYLLSNRFQDTLCDNLSDDFSEEYIDYKYRGYWDSLNYSVFESVIYEELIYFVYNMLDGEKIFLWSVPVLSPGKNFIITSSSDLVSGFQPTGLQLLEFEENKCEMQFELEFERWGPDSCFWVNDNEVVCKRSGLNL